MDAATIGFVALAVIVLLIIARAVYRLILGQSMSDALINQDNRAAAVALGGFLLGVVNVVIPILSGPSHEFWADARGTLSYGVAGILAMAVTSVIFDQYSRATGLAQREQIARGNLAAGIIGGAVHLASSQIVAGALTGDGGAIITTIVFWLAGVAALIVITHLFRLLTGYDDSHLISEGNVAAALGNGRVDCWHRDDDRLRRVRHLCRLRRQLPFVRPVSTSRAGLLSRAPDHRTDAYPRRRVQPAWRPT